MRKNMLKNNKIKYTFRHSNVKHFIHINVILYNSIFIEDS